ncbi:UDP-N-acetylglucosamine--LPS N-acetylglucosamine transferase [Clostridium sp. YIM B02505]|uniref:UDP-N-acetylglucosamine--LPS N-acetylglucosamine transferase n=1 Tax=Clostridium yunnanense TaxID=2800325 RepID=A0ABS1EPY0_9CLOT|nr:glycosyltransferase [Clostridium yunnanense]MBK1811446.1 UDP-N-acetylglucosamine--LPS N-acetylglucosamine transferase [Clostridium yunnanense]
MKKLLILTASTGQGHNQAADSLVETFSQFGYEVIKYDFLYNSSKLLNNVLVVGYELFATKAPNLYGTFYKATNIKSMNNIIKVSFWKTSRKLLKFIDENKPDLIIGTHPFTINVVSMLKKNQLTELPFISVVTDFKAHYTYVSEYVDAYVTGSEYTKNDLISRGINSNLIFPYGIPIRREFYTKNHEYAEVKDSDYFNILLMSGSMGLTNIYYVLKELVNNKHKLRITVVCGKNTNLKNKLLSSYSSPIKDKKIHILGYTNDISAIMDYSDIIISKPGGLTVTESIVKNLPLVIPFAIPGQETENTEFLTNEGCAIYVDNLKDLNSSLDKLIEGPEELQTLKKNLYRLSSEFSLEAIVSLADNILEK